MRSSLLARPFWAFLVSLTLCLFASSAEAERLVIQALGDLMLADAALPTMEKQGYDWAFDGTRSVLEEADLNVANLETSITLRGTPADKTFTFRQPPSSLEALVRAKILLVALANNHAGDYGEIGFLDTLSHLDQARISHAGVGKNALLARLPALITLRGRKVGMLSYSLTFPKEFYATEEKPGTPFGHEAEVRKDVSALRKEVDVLLVSFHWGAELMTSPKPYQRQLGRAAIEAGADAVLGTHPHVLQGIEVLQGKPIFYSLGNFAFGSRSEKCRTSVIARLLFDDTGLAAVEARPIHVQNSVVEFNPRLADGELGRSIAFELATKSRPFGTTLVYQDGWAKVVRVQAGKKEANITPEDL